MFLSTQNFISESVNYYLNGSFINQLRKEFQNMFLVRWKIRNTRVNHDFFHATNIIFPTVYVIQESQTQIDRLVEHIEKVKKYILILS